MKRLRAGVVTGMAAVVPLVLQGCSAGSDRRAAEPGMQPSGTGSAIAWSRSTTQLACDDYIGTAAPPGDYTTLGEVVALPASPRHATLQASRSDPAGALFGKSGLVVRSGARVEIVVPPDARDRLRVGWGNPASPAVAVSIAGCPPAGPGISWLAYAGGFFVTSAGCYPLDVRVRDRTYRVEVGVGRPCAGQRPAPEPNQT